MGMDDIRYPEITYRRGAAGLRTAVIRRTGIRVQAVFIAHEQWGMSPAEIAAQYEQPAALIGEALAFYAAHRAEIDRQIAQEAKFT